MKINEMYGVSNADKIKKVKKRYNPLNRFYVVIFFLIYVVIFFSSATVTVKSTDIGKVYIDGAEKKLEKGLVVVTKDDNGNEKKEKNNGKDKDNYHMISLKDIRNIFTDNIHEISKGRVIIPGRNNVAVFESDKDEIDLDGEKHKIQIAPKIIGEQLYIALEDLTKLFEFEIQKGSSNIIILFDNYDRKYITVKEDTKLKNNPSIFSGTISKLKADEKYLQIAEENNKKKIMTKDLIPGYVSKKDITSELIAEGKKKQDELKIQDVSIIENYSNFKQNFDNVTKDKDRKNICLMDLMILREGNTLEKLYDKENESFKIYRKKLEDENIMKIANLILMDEDKIWYSEKIQNYDNRKNLISEIISVVEEYNLDGICMQIGKITDVALYNRFKIELGTRLKGKGKMLLLKEGNENENENSSKYTIFKTNDKNN